MACHRESKFFQSCTQLVNILQDYASFILGITKQNTDVTPITHSKTMKIRCGGVLGIQRVMNIETNSPPVIPDIISLIAIQYGDIKNFPYNEIIQDIKKFNLRKSNKSH